MSFLYHRKFDSYSGTDCDKDYGRIAKARLECLHAVKVHGCVDINYWSNFLAALLLCIMWQLYVCRLLGLTVFQAGVVESVAGMLTYFVVMAQYGFLPALVIGIRDNWNSQALNAVVDSYGQEWVRKKVFICIAHHLPVIFGS